MTLFGLFSHDDQFEFHRQCFLKDFRNECTFKRRKGTSSKLGFREIPSPDLKRLSK